MKVLWFCNVILPRVAKHLSCEDMCFGSWLVGLSDSMLCSPDIELSVAFPMRSAQTVVSGKADNLAYFAFPQKRIDSKKCSKRIEAYAREIIASVNPDIVHIFGTEFPHTLAIVNVCERFGVISRVLINIQALVSIFIKHYYTGLPGKVINGYTLRDFIRQNNIRQQANEYRKRGVFEIEALKKVYHVSGRTDWDKACTSQINPNAQYHFCNETLRDEFYKHKWDIAKCERHSIFISQADYPIKGVHFVLEALPEIIRKFPDTHLYIAGNDVTKDTAPLTQKMKTTYYGMYLKQLIKKNQLGNYITFVGALDEETMCNRFLMSNVFISSSSLENECNSLSEARLLGVPTVASFVGGVTERLVHHKSGFYYQHDTPYMLAYYVCRIFSDDDLALKFSQNAREYAQQMHDKYLNAQRMMEIYREIEGHGK